MNWKTKQILNEAKRAVVDEGVFTPDQTKLLQDMVEKIGEAIDNEADVNKPSVNYHV